MAREASGNRRAGFLVGGVLLLFLGLGLAIVLNLLLHQLAPPPPECLWVGNVLRVCSGWGWGATIVVCLGVLTSLAGTGLLLLGLQMPSAPLRLFDTEGKLPPDPSEP